MFGGTTGAKNNTDTLNITNELEILSCRGETSQWHSMVSETKILLRDLPREINIIIPSGKNELAQNLMASYIRTNIDMITMQNNNSISKIKLIPSIHIFDCNRDNIKYTLIQSQVIYVNRFLLSARSDVFEAFLVGTGQIMKTYGNEIEITLDCISNEEFISLIEAFHSLIIYLYTDCMFCDPINYIYLIRLADKFQLPQLLQLCEWKLSLLVDVDNVCKLADITDDDYGWISGSFDILQKICIDELLKYSKFKELEANMTLKRIFDSLIKSQLSHKIELDRHYNIQINT